MFLDHLQPIIKNKVVVPIESYTKTKKKGPTKITSQSQQTFSVSRFAALAQSASAMLQAMKFFVCNERREINVEGRRKLKEKRNFEKEKYKTLLMI